MPVGGSTPGSSHEGEEAFAETHVAPTERLRVDAKTEVMRPQTPVATRPPPVAPGDLVAGKYRVESILGEGGMGVVVAARHVALGRDVAIKFLLPAVAKMPDVSARFLREARATAKLESEHVVRVLDVDVLPDGSPYIVMERLLGEDLSSRLDALSRVTPEEAVTIVCEVCEALEEAHDKGLVHRDLKPANLFLARRGDGRRVTKILDFGIAKSLGTDTVRPTGEAGPAMLGSPRYMSPEQARAGDVDRRADIWALGAVLYEALSGRPAFDGGTLFELLAKIVMEPPPSLATEGVPAALEAAVLRCLQKDPAARFQNVAELAEAIAPFGDVTSAPIPGGPRSGRGQSLQIGLWPKVIGVAVVFGGAAFFAVHTLMADSPPAPARDAEHDPRPRSEVTAASTPQGSTAVRGGAETSEAMGGESPAPTVTPAAPTASPARSLAPRASASSAKAPSAAPSPPSAVTSAPLPSGDPHGLSDR